MIFPVLQPSQSNGIEDARFVEFEEAGRMTYYATYKRLYRPEHPLRTAGNPMTS